MDENVIAQGKEVVDSDDILPSAPLTSSMNGNRINNYYRHGRKVIKIPVSDSSLNEKVILKWLPRILADHFENASDYQHFDDVYRGKSHILGKIRPYNSDKKKNTIINENHAFYMIEFKKGYMYGNPIKYSCDDDTINTESITFLNRYMKSQGKAKKDIDLGEDIFKAGNGYRMILPKKYKMEVDFERMSPFEIFNTEYCSTFVVYSSHYRRKKLFAGIITTIDSPNPDEPVKYEILVYSREHTYRYECHSKIPVWEDVNFIGKKPHFLNYIPIVEYYVNSARMGVIDIAESLFDAINDLSSDSIDNVNDFVNSILAIYNMAITREDKELVEQAGAISLITNDPNKPADAKYIVNQLVQADVMTRYETAIKWAYNICGVPQPTQKSTSGGDTGAARELGGGYESANIVANQNEEPLKEGDRLMLEVALGICSMTPKCPVNDLMASDIEINFNRTRSDNLLVKTQSLETLDRLGIPEEVCLNIVGLTGNAREVAIEWKSNKEEKKKENLDLMKQQSDLSQKKDEPQNIDKQAA